MKVFIVEANRDTIEGRGPMYLVAAFTTLDLACEYVSGRYGVMGRHVPFMDHGKGFWTMHDHDIKEIVVHDSIKGLKAYEKERLRKQALERLSEEEKEALGVK